MLELKSPSFGLDVSPQLGLVCTSLLSEMARAQDQYPGRCQGFLAQDISFLRALGWGTGQHPELFVFQRVRFTGIWAQSSLQTTFVCMNSLTSHYSFRLFLAIRQL